MITASEVQATLKDLIQQFGPPNDSNTRMYSSVLKSALANSPKEAGLIDLSLDEKIPARLNSNLGNPQIIPLLVQELSSRQRIDNQSAEWVVTVWAQAMGIQIPVQQPASQPSVSAPQYQPPAYIPQTPQHPQNGNPPPTPPYQSPDNPQYGQQNYQQPHFPPGQQDNNYSPSQGYQDPMLCPQCRAPLPKNIGERCTRCGYSAAKYGGFLRRFAASFIDGIILNIISLPFVFIALASLMRSGATFLLFFLLTLAIGIFYYVFFESSRFQGTPGKMALGIKVVDSNFLRISFGKAFIRYLGRIVCTITLGIGFLLIIFTEKNQGLNDLIAGTYVIHR
jgi:uncharacterized RDD family membrane protein YckC